MKYSSGKGFLGIFIVLLSTFAFRHAEAYQDNQQINVENIATSIGDKIHFQLDNIWLSALKNQTLCQIGEYFKAEVLSADGNKRNIYQKIDSWRLACNEMDNSCASWTPKRYNQSTTLNITTSVASENRTYKFLIPKCNPKENVPSYILEQWINFMDSQLDSLSN